MTIIDSQVHAYEANTPKRPWHTVPNWPDVVADWRRTPGAVGVRIMLTKDPGRDRDPADPGLDRICRAAVKHDLPVNILCWGNVDAGTAVIDRHPDTRFIIDH